MDKTNESKDSKHKYSSMILLIIGGLIIVTSIVAGIDGFGTKNYVTKFSNGETIVNSQIVDDGENVTINGSKICTQNNSLCSSGSVTNNYYNVTNTTINNFTTNESKFPINLTNTDVESIITIQMCLKNDTCYSTAFTDSTGTYDDTALQTKVNNLNSSLLNNITWLDTDTHNINSSMIANDSSLSTRINTINSTITYSFFYKNNTFYDGQYLTGSMTSTIVSTRNQTLAYPVILYKPLKIYALEFEVITIPSPLGNCSIGIYNDTGDVYPDKLQFNTSIISVATTGAKQQNNTPITLQAGLYWFASNCNNNVTLRHITATSIINVLGTSASGTNNKQTVYYIDQKNEGALNTSFPIGATISGGTTAPAVRFKAITR